MKLERATIQNFCEEDYLLANPDIREAVERGVLASGRLHFFRYGRREGRHQRAPLVFFLHIPKTAGSTINLHLKERFANGSEHCEAWLFQDEASQLLNSLTWISGHVRYPEGNARIRQCTNRRVQFFTCVRDPTEQVRSHYNWLIEIFRRGGEWYDPLPSLMKDMSEQVRGAGFSVSAIQKNLLRYKDTFLNFQSGCLTNDKFMTDRTLDTFVYVATPDQIPELFRSMTGNKLSSLRRENESPHHVPPEVFYSPEMQSFLGLHNALDEQLFRFAKTLKPARVAWSSYILSFMHTKILNEATAA